MLHHLHGGELTNAQHKVLYVLGQNNDPPPQKKNSPPSRYRYLFILNCKFHVHAHVFCIFSFVIAIANLWTPPPAPGILRLRTTGRFTQQLRIKVLHQALGGLRLFPHVSP